MAEEKREQRVGEMFHDDSYLSAARYLDGMRNPTADAVPRTDRTWSDLNLADDFGSRAQPFERLVCRGCGGRVFEVLRTADYQTTARCPCGLYYVVHEG